MTKSMSVLLTLWTMLFAPLCQSASKYDGLWRGTYASLHLDRLPEDGSDLEKTNEFELRLHERKGTVTGEFMDGSPVLGPGRSIMNGKIFGDRACFDVVNEYGDMRWCVMVSGDRLSGAWSSGPEGGPLLGGAGVGVRFFRIGGRKVGADER
jgi:hypothetical protein